MAKGKKTKKELDVDDDGSIPSEEEAATEEKKAGGKKGKKEKQKKKEEETLAKAMDDMSLSDSDSEPEEKPLPKEKKKTKKKEKKAASSDSEAEEEVVAQKSGFALLMDDGDDSLPSEPSDVSDEEVKPEPVKQTKPEKKGKKDKKKGKSPDVEVLDEEVKEVVKEDKGGKKKKKKKGKKADDDDDDLDAMLAALKAEYDGEEPPPEAADAFDKEDGKKGKKKKKGKQETDDLEDAGQMGFEVIDGMEVGGTVKTAAQKKKEKKEKQKQKDFEAKKNASKKEPSEDKEFSKEPSPAEEKDSSKEPTPEQEDKEDPEDESKLSKKALKKKKQEEEEAKKKEKKKPANKTLAAMKEALIKVQEEEERQKKEFEDKEREAEERDRLKAEQKVKDEERKALKKQREKERNAKLKAEGKLLTAKQKQDKARAEAMLSAMRAQGADVPQIGEKRAPRAGTRIRPNKKKHEEAKAVTPEVETPPSISKEESPVSVEEEPKVVKDEAKDAWDADSGDDVKDAWDAESDDEKKLKEAEVKIEEKPTETKVVEEVKAAESSDDDSDESEDESEESDEESEDESEEDDVTEVERKKEMALERIQKRRAVNEKARTTDKLRAPVVCVLGHVDTGKTKILDKLRRTNVQDGEAGGITQQIGATNVPIEIIQEQCKNVRDFGKGGLKLPGLLIIDTPGHESFSNLRDRGSSLCDIAILVIDIMHGLEPQTIESINLLKKKKTPFVVALNKVDRLYEWKPNKHMDVRDVLGNQQHNTKMEFEKRRDEVILQLAEQSLNAALFYENPDPSEYISLVPTSAHSGDGMGNLMGLLVEMSQTFLAKRLSFSEELQATVLEVKDVGGFGTTIDIVLVNGRLKFGQTMVIAGTNGPIVTTIKALLTPKKLQDLRVKSQYIDHKNLEAAQGVKIAAKELGTAIAGLNMRVAHQPDEVDILREECERDLSSALNAIKCKTLGVFVQASTLGSLEALLEFLKTTDPPIPYAGVRIGPVVRRDVMRACAMLDHEPKYAVILAFDVKVERDAQEFADKEGVTIFQADIIYHLFDRFTEYQKELVRKKKDEFKDIAVFPCKLKIMPENIYMSRDPIVCGVTVVSGVIKPGTPICVPSKEFVNLGICTSLQHNNKEVQEARKGSEVCIKIEPLPGEAPKMIGRHFMEDDMLISKISRESIDACKDYFRDDLQKTDWILMKELKKLFEIM